MINWLEAMFLLETLMLIGTAYYMFLIWASGILAMLKQMAKQNRWGLRIKKADQTDWMGNYEERK